MHNTNGKVVSIWSCDKAILAGSGRGASGSAGARKVEKAVEVLKKEVSAAWIGWELSRARERSVEGRDEDQESVLSSLETRVSGAELCRARRALQDPSRVERGWRECPGGPLSRLLWENAATGRGWSANGLDDHAVPA